MITFRRPPNLKDKLLRAKIPIISSRPRRKTPGMRRCRFVCVTCPYVHPGKVLTATATNLRLEIQSEVDCQTSNLVYLINCNKCREQYIGQSGKTLAQRFRQHRGYVINKELDKATGAPFNLPGHTMVDMTVSVVEKISSGDPPMIKVERDLL